MRVEHTLVAVGRCLLESCPDVYTVTVRTGRVAFIEAILQAVRELTAAPLTQEQFTQGLADALGGCEVETVGTHGGVTTRVICGGVE